MTDFSLANELKPADAMRFLMPPDNRGVCAVIAQKKTSTRGKSKGRETMPTIDTINQRTAFRVDEMADSVDLYGTVNGMRQQPQGGMTRRRKSDIRSLNAAYSDVDTYKVDALSFGDAVEQIDNFVRREWIPAPSVIARSGRGLYLFWQLHEEGRSDTGVRITGTGDPTLAIYEACLKEIYNRLEPIGADFKSTDAARVLRLPGSISGVATSLNGGVPVRCQYHLGYSEMRGGRLEVARYTVPQLAELLNVDARQITGRQTVNKGSCPNRRAGQIAAFGKRATTIESIWREAGYPKQGRRRISLAMLGDTLRAQGGMNRDEMESRLASAAAHCRPPFPTPRSNDPTIKQIVTDVLTPLNPRSRVNGAVLAVLGIDPKDAPSAAAPLLPKPEPIRFSTKDARPPRRRFIAAEIARDPKVSARQLHRRAVAAGHLCSLPTVSNDLEEMGYKARAKSRKPRSDAPTLPLFEAGA